MSTESKKSPSEQKASPSNAGGSASGPATYTAEEQAFHKNFPAVPLNEKLVENYQCGLSKSKIVSMGRLYLTSIRMCFFSSFPKKSLHLEWDTIKSITHKANFVFEAVVVTTNANEEHFFSAFMFGQAETAAKLMHMLWSVRKRYANGAAQPAASTTPPPVAAAADAPTESAEVSSGSAPPVDPPLQEAGMGNESIVMASAAAEAAAALEKTQPPAEATVDDKPAEEPEEVPAATAAERTVTPPATSAEQSASSPTVGTPVTPQSPAPGIQNTSDLSVPDRSGAATPEVAPARASPEASNDVNGASAESITSPTKSKNQSLDVPNGNSDAPVRSKSPRGENSLSAEVTSPMKVAASSGDLDGSTDAADAQPVKESRASKKRGSISRPRADSPEAGSSLDSKHEAVLANFPAVPRNETIIDSFKCSLVSGVHRLGKMHVTTNYILFSSVMYSDGVCVKFSDLKSVEKQTNMVVFEGVLVTTKAGKVYEFTSFMNRDAAYRILQQLHVAHVGRKQQQQQAAREAASPEAAIPEKQAPARASTNGTPPPLSSPVASAAPAAPSTPAVAAVEEAASPKGPTFTFLTSTAQPFFDSFPAAENIRAFDSYATEYGTGFSPIEKLEERVIVPESKMPTGYTVIDIFRYCFDDDTKLLDTYHEDRKDSSMDWSPWRPCTGNAASVASNNGQRIMKCKTIIRAVFQQTCDFTEFGRYAFFLIDGKPTLLVHFSGQAVGVPQSDTFRAETLFVFTQTSGKSVSADTEVVCTIYGHIQFVKTCWIKGKILKTALGEEMPESYDTLLKMSKSYVSKIPPSGVGLESPAPRAIAEAEFSNRELRASVSGTMTPKAESPTQHRHGTYPPVAAAPVTTVAAAPAAPPLVGLPQDPMALMVARGVAVITGYWALKGLWVTYWTPSPSDEDAAALVEIARSLAMALLWLILLATGCAGWSLFQAGSK